MNKEVVMIHYWGGKFRISDEIVAFLEANRKPNQGFFEPFVGGLNITPKMSGSRTASDINEYLICLYQALQQGYELPDHCTKEQYDYMREHQDEDKALAGFIGIACSFAGKWWGGYARDSRLTDKGRDHCEVGKRSILKKMETCQDVEFMSGSYDEFIPHDMLIYCDPPWRYGVWSDKGKGRSAENHYPTMSVDDICRLPVADIAADDCALFMWATFPNLMEAFDVIKAWGFDYKTVALLLC